MISNFSRCCRLAAGALTLLSLFAVRTASAAPIPAVSYSSAAYSTNSTTFSLGYTFTVGAAPLHVTSVGYLNDGTTGAKATHQVQIYQVTAGSAASPTTGNPVLVNPISVTTTGSSPSYNTFSYTPLANPVTLAANTTYEIVGENNGNGFGIQAVNPVFSGITYGTATFAVTSTPDFNPNTYGNNNVGHFGPTFQYTTAPAPITAVSYSSATYGNNATAYSLGYTFTVGSAALSVTTVGYLNDGATGANATHQVQIYQVTGGTAANPTAGSAVLAAPVSVTTSGSTPAYNTFSYAPLSSPVTLSAGTTYEIVATNNANGFGVNAVNPVFNGITYGTSTFAVGTTPAFNPNAYPGNNVGHFGPTFQYLPAAAATPYGQISVLSPAYCSTVQGNTPVAISAPGFTTAAVQCWQQGSGFGSSAVVATVALDASGGGAFVFPADRFPHGPVTVTLSGLNGTMQDNCYLQLYNKGGVVWNQGIPASAPPAAAGMSLAFADDFNGPLSISDADPNATYYDHKPPYGVTDFSTIPFTSYQAANNPFTQVDSYLRIRASTAANSTGLLSSEKSDGTGFKVTLPCYFEARFVAPNAPGSWPSFWLLTDYVTNFNSSTPTDEFDIIEAYGGEGPGEPDGNYKYLDLYQITPHAYNQGDAGNAMAQANYAALNNPASMSKFGIPSTWYETFHTYGCKITATDTIYYCDNIEMGRHPTQPVTQHSPLFFLVDLATGGGWPVNLSRYNGLADMYVDYIRVYKQN